MANSSNLYNEFQIGTSIWGMGRIIVDTANTSQTIFNTADADWRIIRNIEINILKTAGLAAGTWLVDCLLDGDSVQEFFNRAMQTTETTTDINDAMGVETRFPGNQLGRNIYNIAWVIPPNAQLRAGLTGEPTGIQCRFSYVRSSDPRALSPFLPLSMDLL